MIGAPELWRSKRVDGGWAAPEQMFVNFAGEASLDRQGNVYFTHHFYENDRMREADIYYARKRNPNSNSKHDVVVSFGGGNAK
jgi:hypothetical protein